MRHFHNIDGDFSIHITLELTLSERIGKFSRRPGDDCVAIIIQPVDNRPNRRMFRLVRECGMIDRANKTAFWLKKFKNLL